MVMTQSNVCDVCNTKVCCQRKNCPCSFTALQLAARYKEQQLEAHKELESVVKKKMQEDGLEYKVELKSSQRCPNPNCEYKRYYCKTWCLTNPEFDVSSYK